MKSRKGVELVAQARRATALATSAELAERVAPYRAGYTPQQRRELEARLVDGELLGGRHDRRARAGHRHRRARRGGLRDVPGHGRLAAPDVGPRRAARARARGLRRRRGRARPVLLPPPRRVPRPAGRGRDPRPRERADPPAAPAVRRARGRRSTGRRRRVPRARAGARTPRRSSRAGELRRARAGASCCAQPEDYPAARVSLRSASPRRFAIVDVELGRAARHGRGRARVLDRPRGRGLPAPGPLLRGARARPRRRAARSSSRSTATGTRSPRRETDTYIERLLDRRETLRRDAVVRARQRHRAGARPTSASACGDHEVIDLRRSTCPQTTFQTQALWYELGGDAARRGLPARRAARRAARRRARADRGAAAAGDVRPLGHRRPVDERRTRRPAARRSSSTTAIPAASASRARASARSRRWSPTRTG